MAATCDYFLLCSVLILVPQKCSTLVCFKAKSCFSLHAIYSEMVDVLIRLMARGVVSICSQSLGKYASLKTIEHLSVVLPHGGATISGHSLELWILLKK